MPSRPHDAFYSSPFHSNSLALSAPPRGFVPSSQDVGFYGSVYPQFETGWVPDYVNGGVRYLSSGRVEEVDSDGSPLEDYDELDHIPCPPAPRINAWELAPWTPRLSRKGSNITLVDYPDAPGWAQYAIGGDHDEDDEDASVFAAQQRSSPPNRPRRRSSAASFGARHHIKPYPAQSPRFPLSPKTLGLDYVSAQNESCAASDISQEVQYALLQVQFLAFHFTSDAAECDVNRYLIQTCERIAEALNKMSILLAHQRHPNPSHVKSLHRTIKRLVSVVEHRPTSWSHCKKILDKLSEHQAKLSSLLKKFSS